MGNLQRLQKYLASKVNNVEKQAAENTTKGIKFDTGATGDILVAIFVPLIVAGVGGIVRLFNSLRRRPESDLGTPEASSTHGSSGWSELDYKNYQDFLARTHVLDQAHKDQEIASMTKFIEYAKTQGNVSSVSVDEHGTHKIVFRNDNDTSK